MKTGVFSGTFDPITLGHSDLVTRACQLFDKVIVAVAQNPGKKPLLTLDTRVKLVTHALAHLPNVEVLGFTGLLIDFMHTHQAGFIIRSLRNTADFEHESQLAFMNQQLAPDIQTLFLHPTVQYAFISSSLVREIAQLGGDVSAFVSPHVVETLKHHGT